MTVPPFQIIGVPVPKLPILSPPPGLLFQVEPGPVTVTPAYTFTNDQSLLFNGAGIMRGDGKRE